VILSALILRAFFESLGAHEHERLRHDPNGGRLGLLKLALGSRVKADIAGEQKWSWPEGKFLNS
jgi:hypothetical protein